MTTADLTDRAKLLAFLKSGSEERQAKRPRVAENASFGSDGLLDGPPGVVLHGCRSLSDRNSILLSKTKVGRCAIALPLKLSASQNFAPVLEMLQSALRGQLSRPRDGKPSMAAAPVVKSSRHAPRVGRSHPLPASLPLRADIRRCRSSASGRSAWAHATWTSWGSTQTPPSSQMQRRSPCPPSLCLRRYRWRQPHQCLGRRARRT